MGTDADAADRTPMFGAPVPLAPTESPAAGLPVWAGSEESPITGTPVPAWAANADDEEPAAAEAPMAPSDPAVWSAERLGETGPIPLVSPTDQPFEAYALETGTLSDQAATLFSPHSGAVAPAWRTAETTAETTADLPAAAAVGLAEPQSQPQPAAAWPPPPYAPEPEQGFAPPPPAEGGSGGNRRLLVIGGGLAGALLIGAVAFAGIGLASGSSGKKQEATAPRTSASAPAAQPSASAPAPKPSPTGTEASIDNAATDTKPLTLSEVFPVSKMSLGGKNWAEDKTSVNHDCGLTARGAMATALVKGHCSSVVRATWVSGDKKYAVTAGVAILPTRAAAQTAAKAGDPSAYEWFRGMTGKVAKNIDAAGGFASSTVLGRYVIYTYAQYVDGTKAQATDPALKALTHDFLDYAQRPISKRSH
jgi:hypothetical protein